MYGQKMLFPQFVKGIRDAFEKLRDFFFEMENKYISIYYF